MPKYQSQKMGSEAVACIPVEGFNVEIVGCYDETTVNKKYDYYDLFVCGNCINEGTPLYKRPTKKQIRPFLIAVGLIKA